MSQLAEDMSTLPALERTCPIDLRKLPPVPRSTDAEIREAVARAREAQAVWREMSFEDRAHALTGAAKAMLARRAEGTELARDEVGKLAVESLFDEGIG